MHSDHYDRRISELTDAQVQFGLIPPDHWHQPESIDEVKATAARQDMIKNNVIYGGEFISCADGSLLICGL
jgi:alpha 1,2-mannosyltransferase